MAQTIKMAAILARDGRLFLVRREPSADWELPGGALQSHHEDVDAGMEVLLREFGVTASDLATDFVETVYMRDSADSHVVYNVYAPRGWSGDPTMAAGVGSGWFAFDELDAVRMDERVRRSVMVAFGMAEPEDDSAQIMAALGAAMDEAGIQDEPRVPSVPAGFAAPAPASAAVALDGHGSMAVTIGVLAAIGQRKALRRALDDAFDRGFPADALTATLRVVSIYAGLPVAEDAAEVARMVMSARGLTIPGELR